MLNLEIRTGVRGLVTALIALLPLIACAHIGDQNVFFEGHAGPYPVRVIVRPPGVIPGLAEISVRVETNGVHKVTVLPMRWDTGRTGAPPPDEARPVRGETNLFSGELWFMRDGAQSVEVAISGGGGVGKVIVPVNAVATRVLGMTPGFRAMLLTLGVVLIALAVSIAGAAVRESVLPAGTQASSQRRWFARGTVVVAAVAILFFLRFGKNWWDKEAADYRNNRLYQTLEAKADVRVQNGERILSIERAVNPARKYGPLVPEHGKLMHLFLVREPGMDVFAHLHPMKLDWKTFQATLPALPGGEYKLYADVTYETGFSETHTANVQLPEATIATSTGTPALDADDGWRASDRFAGGADTNRQRVSLSQNLRMDMNIDGPLIENRETRLRFAVRDVILRPVPVEHFMGMGGHLILRRDDGSVFTHLHPSGSFSMAAQQLFELRVEGKAPMKIGATKGDPVCKLPPLDPAASAMRHEEISFPYAFPKAGAYRLWAQVKVRGEVLTGVFDVKVAPSQMANR
ncbi:MAG TPA: hypothetical protein VGF13_07475 [Verrucomicrobiae bacterium]